MWIVLAVLLYFAGSAVAAVLIGRCVRFGLKGRSNAEDLLREKILTLPSGWSRSQKRVRHSAALSKVAR